MESKIPKNFIHFFSLGFLTTFYTLTLLYLVYPEKFKEIYQLYQMIENTNSKNIIILLLTLFLLPVIYTFGAIAFYGGEGNISKYFNAIPEKQLIEEIRFKRFLTKVEDNLRISDLIYASEENIWISDSRKFHEYSNFFAGVFTAITFGIALFVGLQFVIGSFIEGATIKSLTPILFLLIFNLPPNVYYSWNIKKKFFEKLAKISLNPMIASIFYTLLLGLTLCLFKLEISSKFSFLNFFLNFILPTTVITGIVLIFSSALSISFKQKANYLLVLGAESNKILKFNDVHLPDNGSGQHLCSPQDSSTKPQ